MPEVRLNFFRKRIFLIPLSFGIACGLAWIYCTHFSIFKWVFSRPSVRGEKIGVVKKVTGKLRLQAAHSLEYVLAQEGTPVYLDDTVMTGPEDRATLSLIKRGEFEIKPGSLVHLSFKTAREEGDEQAQTIFEPISRESPTPVPEKKLILDEPKEQSTQPPQVHIVFLSPDEKEAKVGIAVKNSQGKSIAQGEIAAHLGRGECLVNIPEPGKYKVYLISVNGVSLNHPKTASFKVKIPRKVKVHRR